MTIQLPEDLERSIRDAVARGPFASADEVVVEALRAYLGAMPPPPAPTESVHDILDRLGLIGCVEDRPGSPDDLATNPAHLEGFGRD